MFLEISKKKYLEMQKMLEEMGVKIEVSDCSVKGDKEPMVHIELLGLTDRQREEINRHFGRDTVQLQEELEHPDVPGRTLSYEARNQAKELMKESYGRDAGYVDRDGNGMDDDAQEEREEEIDEKRRQDNEKKRKNRKDENRHIPLTELVVDEVMGNSEHLIDPDR